MATTDFVVKNGLVVTDSTRVSSTTDSSGSNDTSSSLYVAGGVSVAKKLHVGTEFSVGSNVTLSQDLAVNGGDLTTNQTTFNLVNTTATTVNFAGAGTDIQIGAATGTTNINNNLDVDGDVNIDGGDLTVSTAIFNLANTNATTGNLLGAATAVNIGAATGTLTVGNPTLTMTQGVAVNINGVNPVIASTNNGTASLFNSNITAINFGQAAAISMGSASLNTTVRGNLLVNGNTTLGDASADLVTFNSNTAIVPNSLTFTIDDAIANNITYPVAIRHTTSGTAANGIGVGLQFVTETAGGVNRVGVNLGAIAISAANGTENFSFVVDTMTNGGTAVQALSVNNNTVTVGASSTATTINTQTSSNLTVTAGASGVTSNGNTVTVQGGLGGVTSGAGGAVNVFGGNASTSGTGGVASFRAGNATGSNIVGADTVIEAGQGTGTGRSGQIVFRTGPGGVAGAVRNPLTTVLILTEGGIEIPGSLLVEGNLTVNGLVTTVNSTTLTVDDKNIELGSVVAKGSLQATLATGTAVVTLTTGDTRSLIAGMSLTVNVGPGAFGASAVIAAVNSLTQFTASINHAVAGTATFTAGGVTDFTADGGGITVKGTTDKTFNWVRSSGHWTANTNISAPSLVSTVANGTAPLIVTSSTVVTNFNADLLDGLHLHTGRNDQANRVVRTQADGYIDAGWINTTSGDNGTAAIDRVYASNDGYIRYYTPANFRTVLNVPTRTGGDVSGTWAIGISGNAATATNISNTGTVTLATATESNAITVTAPSYTTDTPVKLLNFEWYGNNFSLGNIRTGGATSNGFGVFYTASGGSRTEIARFGTGGTFNAVGAITQNGSQVLTAGNYTSYAPSLTGTGATGTWAINITGNAVNLSTNRTNWSTNGTITAVVGQLAWKNYGNNHTIFDASASTSPDGSAVNNTNAAIPWSGTYPTLMGWNGASTYGVRVDSARVADNGGVTSVTATTPIVASPTTGAVALSHAASGVAAGTYNSVTVNATGHVTAGSNVAITETDTLATVTGRGASTSTSVTLSGGGNQFSGHFYYLPHDSAGNHYPHFNDGGNASGSKVNWRLFTGGTNSVTHTWTTSLATFATNVQVNGSLLATTKSFLIDHPTKEGMKLRYGSLEGPENGVYVRGKLVDADVIELPDYWTGLVDADSITVNLTAAAAGQQLYVDRVENNCVYIVNETGKPVTCFYTVYGERRDVDKLLVEIE